MRFTRRELGLGAFGLNWFDLPPDASGYEHDESGSGQEEVSVVVAGSGIRRVDGAKVEVSAGSVIRFDPESTRMPVAGAEGLTFFSIGAPRSSSTPRGPV